MSGIERFENIKVNTLTKSVDSFGQTTMVKTKLFDTRARVKDVANSLKTTERYRIYTDLVNLVINYSPFARDIAINQPNYSIDWNGNEWRITDVRESNDRLSITLMCYRVDPKVPA